MTLAHDLPDRMAMAGTDIVAVPASPTDATWHFGHFASVVAIVATLAFGVLVLSGSFADAANHACAGPQLVAATAGAPMAL